MWCRHTERENVSVCDLHVRPFYGGVLIGLIVTQHNADPVFPKESLVALLDGARAVNSADAKVYRLLFYMNTIMRMCVITDDTVMFLLSDCDRL